MKLPILVASLCLLLPSVSVAEPYDVHPNRAYPVKILHKLSRGLRNVLTSPTEIQYNMVKEYQIIELEGGDWQDQRTGPFVGFFTGVGYMVARIGVGAAEIVTFPIPTRPFMDPATPPSTLQLIFDGPQPKP